MSDTDFSSTDAKASYGIGLQMGQQLKNTFDGATLDAAIAGMEDAFKLNPPRVSQDEVNEAFRIIQRKIQAQEAENAKEFAAEGEAYLDENAKRDEVIITETGLQYEVVTEGDGDTPGETSTVRTHYKGTLINGTQFDSSYDRGEPAEFPVNAVIAGWGEALRKMKVGAKWKLYIPYQLAYGEHGVGNDIGPYQALLFDIELLGIVD